MRQVVSAVIVLMAALGVQLAMVAGVLRPSLALAFFGYAGLFVGVMLMVQAALRHAARRKSRPPHRC